jgi:hypothetical protein
MVFYLILINKMFEIKEIDKNQDNIIDLGELNDALKPD